MQIGQSMTLIEWILLRLQWVYMGILLILSLIFLYYSFTEYLKEKYGQDWKRQFCQQKNRYQDPDL